MLRFKKIFKRKNENPWIQSLERWMDVRRADSKNVEAHVQIISAYMNLNKVDKAQREVDASINLFFDQLIFKILQARLFYREQKWIESRDMWLFILNEDAKCQEAIQQLALLFANLGEFDKANSYLDRLSLESNNLQDLIVVARVRQREKKWQEAALNWERVLLEQPLLDTYIQLISCYMNLNDFNKAYDTTKEALGVYPNDTRLKIFLARSAAACNKTEESVTAWSEVVQVRKSDFESYYQYSCQLLKANKFAEAEKFAKKAERIKGDEIRVLKLLARISQREGMSLSR